MSKHDLTAGRLREVLTYDSKTGIFQRIVNSRRRPDTLLLAGCKTFNGYISIYIDKSTFTAHRLAWLYVYGKFPDGDIDHINGDRQDNRIENLRDVSKVVNAQNRRSVTRIKATGLPLGVGCRKEHLANPYYARLLVNNKSIHLGYFADAASAHNAYLAAKRSNHQGCTI